MAETVTITEIRVAHIIDGQGRMSFRLTIPPEFSAVEVLGLLAAAQQEVFEAMSGRRNRSCDD